MVLLVSPLAFAMGVIILFVWSYNDTDPYLNE